MQLTRSPSLRALCRYAALLMAMAFALNAAMLTAAQFHAMLGGWPMATSTRLAWLLPAAGAGGATVLALYILLRLPLSLPTFALAVALIAAATGMSGSLFAPTHAMATSFLAGAVAEAVDLAGEWLEPVLATTLLVLPRWLRELVFPALVLFATRFPRPLTPADLLHRAGERSAGRPVHVQLVRVRAALLHPAASVLCVSALVLLANLMPFWLHVLVWLLLFALIFSFFLDQLAVGDAESRSRAGWIMSGIAAAIVLMLPDLLLQGALPGALDALGISYRMPESVEIACLWMLLVSMPVAVVLLGIAVLGRGALHPALAIRRTVVISVLGVLLTLTFSTAQDLFTGWVIGGTTVPPMLGSVFAAATVLVAASPLQWLIDRLFGEGISAAVRRRLREHEPRAVFLMSVELSGWQAFLQQDTRAGVHAVDTLRREAVRLRGRSMRAVNDQVLVEFDSAEKALAAALALRRTMAGRGIAGAGRPMGLRTALHWGDAVTGPGGDLLGPAASAVDALRRCAVPGDILLSEALVTRLPAEGTVSEPIECAAGSAHRLLSHAPSLAGTARVPARWPRLRPAHAALTVLLLSGVAFFGRTGTPPPAADMRAHLPMLLPGDSLFEAGTQLRRAQAHRLEALVRAGVGTDTVHALLLRYHERVAEDLPYLAGLISVWRQREHVQWLIRHRPQSPLHALPLRLWTDDGFTDELRTEWSAAAAAHADAATLEHAVTNLRRAVDVLDEPDTLPLRLALDGRRRFPGDPGWLLVLASIHDDRARYAPGDSTAARTALAFADSALQVSNPVADPIEALVIAIDNLERAGELERAAPYARRLLESAPAAPPLAHRAHTVLGRIALEAGDRATAEAELMSSLAFPGTIRSLRMELARSLLESGARETVLRYLLACGTRTSDPDVKRQLAAWAQELRAGRRPRLEAWFTD